MLRSVLTLLLGSAAAQLGPLVFGPVLSRLYGPEVFGVFHLVTAVAANVAVVACARYEFALPLAQSEAEAQALRSLCRRILLAVCGVCLLGALGASLWWHALWPLAVPLTVAALGGLSLLTLEATRQQRFTALAWARVMQFWGCGAVQAALGLLHAGLWGLLIGPVLAAVAAALSLCKRAPPPAAQATRIPTGREVALQHRDFPLLNTPHAFLGALQDTLSIALIAAFLGPAAAGVWGLALRYLKAPATLAGGAVSQVLYPHLAASPTEQARMALRRVMGLLALAGAALGLLVLLAAPVALPALLGAGWEASGALGQALALYLALHFVASPLGVVTLAWKAQAWALKLSLVGQALFLLALGLPLATGFSLEQAAWVLSAVMAPYFGWYFWRLWHWPLRPQNAAP